MFRVFSTNPGARRFPGLINCTSVDFFHPWPRQALISVAARFLEDVELGEISVKESLAVHMAEEHLSVTKVTLSMGRFTEATFMIEGHA